MAFCESTVNGVAVSLSDSLHESIVSVRTDGKRALVGRIRRVKNVMGCGRIAKNMINKYSSVGEQVRVQKRTDHASTTASREI